MPLAILGHCGRDDCVECACMGPRHFHVALLGRLECRGAPCLRLQRDPQPSLLKPQQGHARRRGPDLRGGREQVLERPLPFHQRCLAVPDRPLMVAAEEQLLLVPRQRSAGQPDPRPPALPSPHHHFLLLPDEPGQEPSVDELHRPSRAVVRVLLRAHSRLPGSSPYPHTDEQIV